MGCRCRWGGGGVSENPSSSLIQNRSLEASQHPPTQKHTRYHAHRARRGCEGHFSPQQTHTHTHKHSPIPVGSPFQSISLRLIIPSLPGQVQAAGWMQANPLMDLRTSGSL